MSNPVTCPEKQLWRHLHAMGAMQTALATLEALKDAYADQAEHLIEPLWVAYFVSYARPFTANRQVGQIAIRHVPNEHRPIHRTCIAARNTLFGHTDPTVRMDDGLMLNEAVLEVDGRQVIPNLRSPLPSPEEIQRSEELVRAVHDSLGQEIASDLTRIPAVQTLEDGVYRIDYSAQEGERLVRVEEEESKKQTEYVRLQLK